MKRAKMVFSGEWFINTFKYDVIALENKQPLPRDAKLLTVDVDKERNRLIIYYESETLGDVPEDGCVHAPGTRIDYHPWRVFKQIFNKPKKKKKKVGRWW